MDAKEIEKIKEGLKKSPIFNFSLGSKELFHSNFIAWLAEKYPKNTGKLFSQFLKKQNGDITIIKVEREAQNRDMCLFFANGQELIIENKVKSIPNRDQLENYSSGSSDNQNFILLTLVDPAFELPDDWAKLSYFELSGLMEIIYSDLGDSYEAGIINDYIFVITSLSKIFQNINVNLNDKFNFYSVNKDDIYSTLNDLRMGDVYQKLKYQMLAVKVYELLRKVFPDEKIFFDDIINRFKDRSPEKIKDKAKQVGCFYFGCGMSRSQGLMEVAYVVKKGLFLTVQIQGDHYRQMVQGYAGYGKDAKKVASVLMEKRLWFNFGQIDGNPKEYPIGTKVFNKYGETDFYRSVSLSPEFTIEQVIGFVVNDIKVIKDGLIFINKLAR